MCVASSVVIAQSADTTFNSPKPEAGRRQAVAPLETPIALRLDSVSVQQALDAIARQARLRISYKPEALPQQRRVTLRTNRILAKDAFAQVLKGLNFEIRAVDDSNFVLVKRDADQKASSDVDAEQGRGTLRGTVVDSATGRGIGGVTVNVVGTKSSTITQIDGTFTLTNIPSGDRSISYKLFGYRAVTKTTTVAEGTSAVARVAMAPVATQLSGVVTTATGLQRKVEVGNDITTISVPEVLKNYPVTSMTDLLATRVPGLVATSVSGQPGAPTRIRIHGISTLSGSNDPIIILDGVQIRSRREQGTDNMNDRINSLGVGFSLSPLNQIDPNSVETVEVLKGPSAVALYGSDAGNGVIVITTKKGVAGPVTWGLSGSWGFQTMPGKWPQNYYAWGTISSYNVPTECPSYSWPDKSCIYDSTEVYQILNNPATTIFGRGNEQRYSANVNGGVRTIRYSFTVSSGSILGLAKLPDQDVQLLRAAGSVVPGWLHRPQESNDQSGTGTLFIEAGTSTDVTFTTQLQRTANRNTPLSGAISSASTFPPAIPAYENGELVSTGSGLLQVIPNFRERQWTNGISMKNIVNVNVRLPRQMLATFTGGLDRSTEEARSFMLTGSCFTVVDQWCENDGMERTNKNTNTTANLKWNLSAPLMQRSLVSVRASVGSDYVQALKDGLSTEARGLPLGATNGFSALTKSFSGANDERRTMGAYAEVVIGLANRIWLPLAVRMDAGNTLGGSIRPKLPKLGVSYLISEQPLYQRLPIVNMIPELRVRAAYGISGRQPSAGAATRSYSQNGIDWDGQMVNTVWIATLGNPRLRPERIQDIDYGFDADLFNGGRGRLSVSTTWTRKYTKDLLSSSTLPSSVGGGFGQTINLGDLRNTVFDGSVEGLLNGQLFTWNPAIRFTRLRNKLVRVAEEQMVTSVTDVQGSVFEAVREGYPVYSRWARPIVGYADIDHNGILTGSEVVLGDSAVYIGAPYPNFTMSIDNRVTLLSQFTVSGILTYENGMTQLQDSRLYDRVKNDPNLSLHDQAYGLYSDLARVQTVSSLRLQSVQINYILPQRFVRRLLPSRSMTLSLQGTNLGLWTNYTGKDPNVGASNETIHDRGQLPTPRVWGISMRIN